MSPELERDLVEVSRAGPLQCIQSTRRNAMPKIRQKITPFLWFNDQAEEAARFYTSLFEDSRVVAIARYTAAHPGKESSEERRVGKECVSKCRSRWQPDH